jgi:hypothetical protein
MIDNWLPIEDAPTDGTMVHLLTYNEYSKSFSIKIGSYREDDYVNEVTWLENDFNDFSMGFASTPITNPIAYQNLLYVDEDKWKPNQPD